MSKDLTSYLNSVLLYFLGAVIILTPIFRGLYFEREWIFVHALTLLLLIAWLAVTFIRRELLFKWSLFDYFALALIIFYILSLINAVNPSAAWQELFKVINYVLIYFFTRTLLSQSRDKISSTRLILDLFLIAGALVALSGLAGASGAIQVSSLFDGTRIHSTLQYHNANAVYLSAMFFLALGLSLYHEKWHEKMPYLASATLSLITVTFTFSRGAWVVLLAAAGLFFLLNLPGKRLASIICLAITGLAAIISVSLLQPPIAARSSLTVFLFLAALILAVLAAAAAAEFLLNKLDRSKASTNLLTLLVALFLFAVPLVTSAAADQGLLTGTSPAPAYYTASAEDDQRPGALVDRISQISLETESVVFRFIYYQTALKIAQDYPVFGAGGGAWGALYIDYLVVEPYAGFEFTSEVHNHYLQILIESGIPGLLAFLGLWVTYITRYARTRFFSTASLGNRQLMHAVFIAALMIGAHSMIDFGLSLGAISIFLWILFAVGIDLSMEQQE